MEEMVTGGSKKLKEGDFPVVDEGYITALTDELLVEILSRLSFNEAARTSVLAKRWIDLGKWVPNLDLDFDSKAKIYGMKKHNEWVDQVLAQHKGPKVNSFRVYLYANQRSNTHREFNRWLKFASSKGVESLELVLDRDSIRCSTLRQHLRYQLFSKNCFTNMRRRSSLSNIRFLRALSLRRVRVTDQMFRNLLADFLLLEKLVINSSEGLVKVNVSSLESSSPLKLKHLEIVNCIYVLVIKFRAPNLVTFLYDGGIVDLQFNNVSSLKEMDLTIECESGHEEVEVGAQTPCHVLYDLRDHHKFSQLETLTAVISTYDLQAVESIHEIKSLKQLVMYLECDYLDDRYRILVPLINACPSLHRLSLRLAEYEDAKPFSDDGSFQVSSVGPWDELRPSIRVVEIIGFDILGVCTLHHATEVNIRQSQQACRYVHFALEIYVSFIG